MMNVAEPVGRFSEALEHHLRLITDVTSDDVAARVRQWYEENDGVSPDKAQAYARAVSRTIGNAETYWIAPEILELLWTAAEHLPDWRCRREDMPSPSGFVWLAHSMPGSVGKAPVRALYWTSQVPNNGREGMWLGFVMGDSSEEFFMGDFQPEGALLSEHRNELEPRLIAAFVLFVQQSIFRRSAQTPDRATRRRIDQWRPTPLVQTVHLRTVHYERHDSSSGEARDWTCRWLVRGHWRNQPYPRDGVIRPKWIAPYVKGPEDKPVRSPRALVFAVDR